MAAHRRATIYLPADIHRALRLKAAAAGVTISIIVNKVLRQALADDAEDLGAAAKRRSESSIDFEQFVKSLRRRGKR